MDKVRGPNEPYDDRRFLSPDALISEKSVVSQMNSFALEEGERWPYSLSEYLGGYVGRQVTVKYSLPGGRWAQAQGWLDTVGSNFLGVRSNPAGRIQLVELGCIISVDIAGAKERR